MTNVVEFEMLFKNAQFIAGLLSGAAAQKKVTEEVGKTTKESRRAEQELSRFAAATKKLDATPYQKYTEDLGKLKRALETGKLEQIDYTRAVKRMQEQLKQADPGVQQMIARKQALQAAAEQEKKLAEAIDNRLKKRASDIGEANMTAVERYSAALAELTLLRDRHGLSQENFNRQLAREKQLLDAADPALQKQQQALAAWQKQLRANSAELERVEDNLDRMAESVKQINATPLEKYNREVAKLNLLHEKGKLTVDELTRAVQREKSALDQTTAAASNMQRSGLAAGMEVAGALGLVTTAAGAASFAVDTVSKALEYQAEKSRKAKSELDNLVDPRISLNQVSDSPEQFQQRLTRARAATEKFGGTEKQATEVLSQVIGADVEQNFEAIYKARIGGMNAADAGETVTRMTKLFPGKISAQESLDMMMKAASGDVVDNVAGLTSGISKAALGGKAIGATPAETLATLTSISDSMGGLSAMAADRMQAFGLKAGRNERLKGRGFIGAMRVLRDEFSEKERAEFLGNDQEMNVAYSELVATEQKNLARTRGLEEEQLASRRGQGQLALKEKQWLATPETRAQHAAEVAAAQFNAANMKDTAVFGANQAAGMSLGEQQSIEREDNFLRAGIGTRVAQLAAAARVPGGMLPFINKLGGRLGEQMIGSVSTAGPAASMAMSLLQDIATNLKTIAAATKTSPKPNLHGAANAEAAAPLN